MIISPRSRQYASGFSLVEIMVAIVVGLLGMIVVMQVGMLFQGQNRTTTASDDSQNSATIALYGLQRDIRQAGYGISESKVIGCNVSLPAGWTVNTLAPVTINHASIPAGDANTDTVLVAYGNSSSPTQGDGITSQPSTNTYAVQTAPSYAVNDLVVATPQARASPCNLTLERVTSIAQPNITVPTGVAAMTNGAVFNLGQVPKIVAYAVRNGQLTACDYTANDCSAAANVGKATIWVPIANNIIRMKALYGRDTNNPMDGIADVYDQTTPNSANATYVCDWVKTSSVRIVLLSRSVQRDQRVVTVAAPTWAGSASNPIDLTADPDWQHYRYKAFETEVPIRNVVWLGIQPGC